MPNWHAMLGMIELNPFHTGSIKSSVKIIISGEPHVSLLTSRVGTGCPYVSASLIG